MSFGTASPDSESPGTQGRAVLDVSLVCGAALVAVAVLWLVRTPWWLVAGIGTGLLVGLVPGALSWYRRRIERGYVVPVDAPPAPRHFFGRVEELERMRDFLAAPAETPRAIVITGPAGIGKTALATRFTFLVEGMFPDGQLFSFVNQPDDKDDGVLRTLGSFIRALQPPRRSVPATLEARARRYAKLTRDRKVVVVLDDVDGVDPAVLAKLFPAGPQCAVVLTARRDVPTVEALAVRLEALSDNEAVGLLRSVVGTHRVADELQAAQHIVSQSSGHPLSVRLAGMSLVTRPHLALELAVDRTREDPSGEARPEGTLDLSFALLNDDQRHALRCLGLLEDRVFAPWMLAALMGVDEGIAAQTADGLSFVGLVQRSSNEVAGLVRFRIHEHVMEYARAMSDRQMTAAQRAKLREALDRTRLRRDKIDITALLTGEVQRLTDAGRLAEAADTARYALDLARGSHRPAEEALALATLADLQVELGYTHAALDLVAMAREAARGETVARAARVQGKAYRRLRRLEDAARTLRAGLKEARRFGDLTEQIRLLRELSATLALGRQPEQALVEAQRAVDLCQSTPGCRALLPSALWAKGNALLKAGVKAEAVRPKAEAAACLAQAERVAAEVEAEQGDPESQLLWRAWIAELRGEVAAALGSRPAEAQECLAEAMARFTTARHRYGIAYCRLMLGRAYEQQADRLDEAAVLLTDALQTFQNCEDPWIEAESSRVLGLVRLRQARDAEATALLEDAGEAFLRLGDDAKLDDVLSRLSVLRSVPPSGQRPAPRRQAVETER